MTLPDPGVTTPPTDEQWKTDIGRAMQVLRFGVAYRELDPDDQRDVLAVAEAIRDAEKAVHARYEAKCRVLDDSRSIASDEGVRRGYNRGVSYSVRRIREVAPK